MTLCEIARSGMHTTSRSWTEAMIVPGRRDPSNVKLRFSCLLTSVCVVLAVAIGLRSADTIPRELSASAFWQMVTQMSEDAGYFRFQFMSNEREFPSVIPELKRNIKPGGVYLGVGPEQNFTYIAATRPKIAFIFDIRRENMLEHLIYKALFQLSPNRADFISRLFSRRPTTGLNEVSSVHALFQAFTAARADRQLFNQNLQAIKEQLTVRPGSGKGLK